MLRCVLMCSQACKDPTAQEGSCLLEQEAERRALEGFKCSQYNRAAGEMYRRLSGRMPSPFRELWNAKSSGEGSKTQTPPPQKKKSQSKHLS